MNSEYLNIYNNLIKLTRNKNLYLNLERNDEFSDRLLFLMFHFALFLKKFKPEINKKKSQELFDFFIRQIELSIREIGYGDVSVNKKMKEYVNMFYAILDKIEVTDMSIDENIANFFRKIFNLDKNIKFYANYYKKYNEYLSNNTLNNFTKDIINHNF
ncbi:MAG: ubiquinol-cytochrome C chaperone family protein [Candidatus Pelagibacter sp.]